MSETGLPVPRIGDAERRVVDDRLQRAVGDGRLTLTEYDERAGQVWQARTRADLEQVVADLPETSTVPEPPRGASPLSHRSVLAVMSEQRISSPPGPGERTDARAVMGSCTVDLRCHPLPHVVEVRAQAVMGDVTVLVPRGARVETSGYAVMGSRDDDVEHGHLDGPLVRVHGVAVMGAIVVSHGPDGPGDSDRPARTSSVSLSKPDRSPSRQRGRRHPLKAAVLAVLVVVGAGGVVSATVGHADARAVFGSSDYTVPSGSKDVDVTVRSVFGSVKVVVPDDAQVVLSGSEVFGSAECKDGCGPVQGATAGTTVRVHSRGAFGSVEVVHAADLSRDDG